MMEDEDDDAEMADYGTDLRPAFGRCLRSTSTRRSTSRMTSVPGHCQWQVPTSATRNLRQSRDSEAAADGSCMFPLSDPE
jgi:hypothetical protein